MKGLLSNNILTFEEYCSKLFHKPILIKDFNEDKTLLEKTFKLIIDDFEEFIMYYSRTNYKQDQVDIWKNILFNIRILFKYKILDVTDNIFNKIENILRIDNLEYFEELLINNDFCDIINKYIMTFFILFDSNEKNKEKIENIFQIKFLVYFIYITFIKSNNNDNIDNFITNNKPEIKKAIDLFCLKYKICLLLFNEKEENINIKISYHYIISLIKSNSDFINLLNSRKKDNYLLNIKEQYMSIPIFDIINLPENGLEFLSKEIGYCFYCHKKNLSSFLCLLCGSKMCNNMGCTVENASPKGKDYSLIYHSKKCCGGNGIFLGLHDTQIIYVLKRRLIKSNIFIYMNDFGEALKEKYYFSDEYKLNKNELNKAIINFIDMTYKRNL